MSDETAEGGYITDWIPITDLLWGRGILAPGGEGNIDQIVKGIDLENKRVLDLGSGAGGGSIKLARDYGALVVGLDIEESFVDYSRHLADEAQCSDQVEFRHIEPGPLPIGNASFDYFYSSGVICHIEDKQSLFADAFRVLKPDGWILGYDWFVETPNPEIDNWMKVAGFHLYTTSLQEHVDALRTVGFQDVTGEDATDWYKREIANELEMLKGPYFDKAAEATSEETRDHFVYEWECMSAALATGGVKQGYFRGRKPH
jgi:phosphoethanolamine N-methyltransferase